MPTVVDIDTEWPDPKIRRKKKYPAGGGGLVARAKKKLPKIISTATTNTSNIHSFSSSPTLQSSWIRPQKSSRRKNKCAGIQHPGNATGIQSQTKNKNTDPFSNFKLNYKCGSHDWYSTTCSRSARASLNYYFLPSILWFKFNNRTARREPS